MEHMETTLLAGWVAEVGKFQHRKLAPNDGAFISGILDCKVSFFRLRNYVLCEIYRPVSGTRLAAGISHKSKTCYRCKLPGDKFDAKVGKTIALWHALDDLAGDDEFVRFVSTRDQEEIPMGIVEKDLADDARRAGL